MSTRAGRSPRWARLLVAIGLVIAVLAGGTAIAGKLMIDRWDRAVGQDTLVDPGAREPGDPAAPSGPITPRDRTAEPTPSAATPSESAPPERDPRTPGYRGAAPGLSGGDIKGPLTYLVIGSDFRKRNPGMGERADAIIIVHIPKGLREAYLISVPRDLLVPIPGHWNDKVNSAYQLGGGGSGGAQLLSKTLRELTGVGFDGAVMIDFSGFRDIVNALGGVEVCLDQQVRSIHTNHLFSKGCQELTGKEALDLARQRYDLPAGDLDRVGHHQRLIQAMVAQAADSGLLTDPFRLDRTVRAVGDALTVDTGGVPLPELAFALRDLRPNRVTGITLPSYPQNLNGVSYVLAHGAADGLYQAIRKSRLERWADNHPKWVER